MLECCKSSSKNVRLESLARINKSLVIKFTRILICVISFNSQWTILDDEVVGRGRLKMLKSNASR